MHIYLLLDHALILNQSVLFYKSNEIHNIDIMIL
jgi:hypothetical protein